MSKSTGATGNAADGTNERATAAQASSTPVADSSLAALPRGGGGGRRVAGIRQGRGDAATPAGTTSPPIASLRRRRRGPRTGSGRIRPMQPAIRPSSEAGGTASTGTHQMHKPPSDPSQDRDSSTTSVASAGRRPSITRRPAPLRRRRRGGRRRGSRDRASAAPMQPLERTPPTRARRGAADRRSVDPDRRVYGSAWGGLATSRARRRVRRRASPWHRRRRRRPPRPHRERGARRERGQPAGCRTRPGGGRVAFHGADAIGGGLSSGIALRS